ncbi:YihY/virulence factor BrkB family protein [Legionella hackeliae]|uniref:Ribonuclease BN n=1 Tax=Legionella hackeliae TaxID=449 RepID=A0A0A8UTW2_LEGHA|nr:YihY/virulence factor BrkB family protein [Legionella hackeliae]KTD13831.1 ribonuclease BN [Legionella hackeliae]CEK10532.1 Ribonuclease BN [Legionella hackeliae]STX47270.1 ribonuclease BN [Legionella hackeliae]
MFKEITGLFKQTIAGWSEDKISTLAAALAYYTIFSMGPVLIISIAIAGMIFGKEAVQTQILQQISEMFGSGSAEQIKTMLLSASHPATSLFAQIVGIVLLLFGAIAVFSELQAGLNKIWNVEAQATEGWIGMIKNRFWSFTMVLVIGFLLLVSLTLTVLLTTISNFLSQLLPGGSVIGLILNFVISLGGITLLFAMIFKILPNIVLRWRDVWLGAFITTLLFTIGKFLLGFYLGSIDVENGFGASASLIIILIWVYYSAQILFLGAEFTKAYVNRTTSKSHKRS